VFMLALAASTERCMSRFREILGYSPLIVLSFFAGMIFHALIRPTPKIEPLAGAAAASTVKQGSVVQSSTPPQNLQGRGDGYVHITFPSWVRSNVDDE
jgi:hypothetical protein